MNPNRFLPNPKLMEELADKLGTIMRQSPVRDMETNLRTGVTAMLGKLDIVSREEFDVQSAVLARTRAHLTRLEARLAELERHASTQPE
jgi:BMFP domain-containing protein YqiC